ncbi:50S ribosomal protein L29 [Mycoplasma zalophi]|uniref:Large ribosomal subunit protein uL29 n=1 Tax=Mycoplasma zalophi TaxID=191287 RepID=A0ABS6DRV9_9MOLU|nr:50S ribosomal protein L29 [Mycoplasma zalophi]MBU4691334.1 50S ribosomal protein L29 [Mycoplasma zalophi]MBU4692560.1 50S ribosomal protein L29 [Mycoplasma zalophi]MCU4117294.1 50S ribosomal protein L29 [Mycoplasma zalophi]
MKYQDLKSKSIEELNNLVTDYKANLFTLRFKARTGQLEQNHKIKDIKRDIARVLTALNEKMSSGETK